MANDVLLQQVARMDPKPAAIEYRVTALMAGLSSSEYSLPSPWVTATDCRATETTSATFEED
jgi:hypothetical protein